MSKNSTSKGDETNVAVFGSGTGSNAQKIIDYFTDHPSVKIKLVVSNKENAAILDKAERSNISAVVIDKNKLQDEDHTLEILAKYNIDFIVLAGFLLKIPPFLIHKFPQKILNIHPALLPDFGGKGMYGMNVHQAVKKSGLDHSGISIHYVDEIYDNGKIVFQKQIPVHKTDSAEDIASKVLVEEHKWYPKIIESLLVKG